MTPPLFSPFVEELNDLIARHRGAIDACDDAAARLDDLRRRVLVRELVTHHIRELEELSSWVSHLGAQPSRQPRSAGGRPARRDDDQAWVRYVLTEEQDLADAFEHLVQAHADEAGLVTDLRRITQRPRRQREGVVRSLEAQHGC